MIVNECKIPVLPNDATGEKRNFKDVLEAAVNVWRIRFAADRILGHDVQGQGTSFF